MDELPQLLVISPSALFRAFQQHFCNKYTVLKAYESPLPTDKFLHKYAQSAEAILTYAKSPITADLLRYLPSLRLVVTSGTGVNQIDLQACRARGISVANTADVFSLDTADYALGLFITVVRKISGGDRFVRSGIWSVAGSEYSLASTLRSKRVGIVGLGNIGLKVARRLEAFGCKILYNSRSNKSSISYTFYPSAVELALHSDALIICCPLTETTRHMINHDVMVALGDNGIIVNIGRGPLVDEKALIKLLMEGKIAGAGLDVFENEPDVPIELYEFDNVVMSPHRAAFTHEAFSNAFQIVTANLDAFFSNRPLISPVRLDHDAS